MLNSKHTHRKVSLSSEIINNKLGDRQGRGGGRNKVTVQVAVQWPRAKPTKLKLEWNKE